ncbi:hypothetical protein [Oceanobacillus sp. CF4.6]|uniref:hypothetical protein n=1 Tax=Oceanobacillus sp. CF4.6 TaxID=3373080 RepID=UPI003EE52D23
MNFLKISKKHNLNLIEVSILVSLNRRYPCPASIEEMTNDKTIYWQIQVSLNKLNEKNLIEIKEQKYKIIK